MQEVFKDIPDYEGLYQVSNLGRVKSLPKFINNKKNSYVTKEKILKNCYSGDYFKLGLNKNRIKKTFRIHQLVAMAFLGHKPNGYNLIIDHINNNKLDNRVENLQIVTPRKNTSKDRKGGTSKYIGVHLESNKWRSSIRINGKKKHLGLFEKEYDAHLAYQNELKTINKMKILIYKEDNNLIDSAIKMLEALQNLENDENQIPNHAWSMVKDAISHSLKNEQIKKIIKINKNG